VILGGGISGALVAWHLIEKGVSCVVVDARSIGLGSTCASTSLLQYEIDIPLSQLSGMVGKKQAERAYILCLDAIDKLLALAARIGFGGIEKKKSLYIAAREKDMPGLRKEFLARKESGIAVHMLERESLLSRTGIEAPGAILSDNAAQTDAYLFTHALHQASIKKGLQVYDRTRITSIDHKPRSVQLVTANGNRISAGKIVYATGYEVVEFIDKPIVKLHSTYAVASEPLTGKRPFWTNEMLLWNTAKPYLYVRATPEGRVIVGGRDEPFIYPHKREKLIGSKTRLLTADIAKLLPGLGFIPEFSWTGTYGVTKDGLPFIGPYRKRPNGYFALGFGGNGITFSLVAAEILADIMTGKKNSDLALFSFERIAQ
jgi:glycine/D-amino acid oxidase-like deaminating enzyme